MATLALLSILLANHQAFSWNVLEAATETLKGHYQERFGYHLENSLADVLHERIFINLTLVPKLDRLIDDGHFVLHNKDFKNVEIANLFNDDNRFVFIRGIGGIGKTHLMEQITLQWANGDLWNDIRYMFLLKCHELERLKVPTIEILLYLLFGNAFQYISYSDVIDKSNETLIILDGLDECIGQLNNSQNANILRLIDPEKNQLMNMKVIATGRPGSEKHFLLHYPKMKVKQYDLLGFSESKVIQFIESSLKNDKKTINTVKELIWRNENLHEIARIPEYLKLICEISGHQEYIVLETVTEALKYKAML